MKRQTLLLSGVLCFLLTGCRSAPVKAAVPAAPASPGSATPVIAGAPSGPPLIPAGPLGDLDQLFIDSYTSTRSEVIGKAAPFVVVSGSNLVLHRNGQKETVHVIPDLYHALKDIAHLPFTVYLDLSPVADATAPITAAKATQLQTLLTRIQSVQGVLATGGYSADEIPRQTEILEASKAMVSLTLKNNRIDRTSLGGFAHRMGPLMLLNAKDAGCIQIQGTHAQMMKWKETLSADEWQHLAVVNRARHQARYRNAATQYFHWLLNDTSTSWSYPGESMRVIYAESLAPKEEAQDELGTVVIDAEVSTAFFDDPWRLSEDILSEGADACIKKLPDADRLHP
jgi:hypothetical protein